MPIKVKKEPGFSPRLSHVGTAAPGCPFEHSSNSHVGRTLLSVAFDLDLPFSTPQKRWGMPQQPAQPWKRGASTGLSQADWATQKTPTPILVIPPSRGMAGNLLLTPPPFTNLPARVFFMTTSGL